ncbi:hypothetical protein EON80_04855 [bacterium]|nr:MAG: hypothetical protein EON80_04855 [bacterium]
MKKLLLLALICSVAHAAPTLVAPPKLDPVISVSEAKVPTLGAAIKPRGTKLLRSAQAPVGAKGKTAWLLFFGRKPTAGTIKKLGLSTEQMQVDLKIVTRTPQGKKWIWRTLRTVPLGYCEEFSWKETSLLWLKPTSKTGPIVRVPRPEGDELIAFPTGWSQKTAVRQFFGRMASSLAAISYQFDKVDESGTFAVTEERSERTEGGSEETYVTMKWNGKEWKE